MWSANWINQRTLTDYSTDVVNCIEFRQPVDLSIDQQHCFTSHGRRKTADMEWEQSKNSDWDQGWADPTSSETVWPIHTDNSLHGEYPCTAWWDWKRSATMISFSHFLTKAPTTDEAGHISLHTQAYSQWFHTVSHLRIVKSSTTEFICCLQ